MAHIETWYRCPACQLLYGKQKDAIACRNSHPIRAEQWAVGKGGKAAKVMGNHVNGVADALREADLSDFIVEREKQLRELKNMKE